MGALPIGCATAHAAEGPYDLVLRNGRIVAPGFVDLRTHAARGIFERPTADNVIRQGATTILEGPARR